MLELYQRLIAMEEALLEPLPKGSRVVNAFSKISGIYLDELTPKVKKIILSSISKINDILTRYPIKTFDDYNRIKEHHLDAIIRIINNMCKSIYLQMSKTSNPLKVVLH